MMSAHGVMIENDYTGLSVGHQSQCSHVMIENDYSKRWPVN